MPLSDYSLHDQVTLFLARPKLELSGPDPFKQIFANFTPRPHLALLTGPCDLLPGSELTNDNVHAVVVTARTPLPIEGEVQYFTELLKLKGEIQDVCRQEYIRRGKESILLCTGVCKHPLKSTKVKLTITASINSTVE